MYISLIFLAGGTGSRMNMDMPKQYLALGGKPLFHHSFETFLQIPEIKEIVVVADQAYRHQFDWPYAKIRFTDPGKRRQDSVFNGFQQISIDSDYVLTHDSARPFITSESIRALIDAAKGYDALTLARKVKYTIRQEKPAVKSLNRENLWEIQTPQLIKTNVMKKGFEYAHQHKITVTDDVMLAEIIQGKIKLIEGPEHNIKVTTPNDYLFVKHLYEKAL